MFSLSRLPMPMDRNHYLPGASSSSTVKRTLTKMNDLLSKSQSKILTRMEEGTLAPSSVAGSAAALLLSRGCNHNCYNDHCPWMLCKPCKQTKRHNADCLEQDEDGL